MGKIIWAAILAAFLMGCGFLGPSDEEVKDAVNVIMDGFQVSMVPDKVKIKESYSNAADLVYRNHDGSILHEMSVMVDGDTGKASGRCVFTDYASESSEYRLSGEVAYDVEFHKSAKDNLFGEISCEMDLYGGKIETLDFAFEQKETGDIVDYWVTANGKEIDVHKWDRTMGFLRAIGMPRIR